MVQTWLKMFLRQMVCKIPPGGGGGSVPGLRTTPSNDNYPDISEIYISTESVKILLKNINEHKASDPDNLPHYVFKNFCNRNFTINYYTDIFNIEHFTIRLQECEHYTRGEFQIQRSIVFVRERWLWIGSLPVVST